jgi:hypothetical protein
LTALDYNVIIYWGYLKIESNSYINSSNYNSTRNYVQNSNQITVANDSSGNYATDEKVFLGSTKRNVILFGEKRFGVSSNPIGFASPDRFSDYSLYSFSKLEIPISK